MIFEINIFTSTRPEPQGTEIKFEFLKDGWNIWAEATPMLDELKKCFPNGESNSNLEMQESGLFYVLESMGCFYYPEDIGTEIEKIWKSLKEKQDNDQAQNEFKKIELKLKEIYENK